MEDNKDKLPGETSKDGESVNVNQDGKDAGDKKPTDTADGDSTTVVPNPPEPPKDNGASKDDANVQQAIQKHAELRRKAETDAAEAVEKLKVAEEEKQALLKQIEESRRKSLESSVRNRIDKSNLPDGLKARIAKDPVKWVLSNADNAPQDQQNVDDTSKFVSENLESVVKVWETELGVANSPIATFVDSDNASIQTPSKTISVDDLKRMSPYEIQSLPKETKEKLLNAGSKVEI